MERLGVLPDSEEAFMFTERGLQNRIIPDAVLKCIANGKPWYRIQFNNEVEKISNTDKIDSLVQLMNIMQGLLAVNPDLAGAVDWFKLLQDVSSSLGFDTAIMSESEFTKQIEAKAQQQAQMQQMQLSNLESQTTKNKAGALRDIQNGLPELQE